MYTYLLIFLLNSPIDPSILRFSQSKDQLDPRKIAIYSPKLSPFDDAEYEMVFFVMLSHDKIFWLNYSFQSTYFLI